VANTAMKLCHRFATEFGFTPSARTRIKVEQEGDADDYLGVPE
jgi:phage terminase small subunit